MKKRYIAAGVAIAGLVAAPFIAQAISPSGQVRVTPNGPTDGGDFGPRTPGTATSGIQEALLSGASFVSVKAPMPTVYPISMPCSIKRSNQMITIDPLATIRVVQQIDGGIFQIPDPGYSGISISGGVWDANRLSMGGFWQPKVTPKTTLSNVEIMNIRGVGGLSNFSNPIGVIANCRGGFTCSNIIVHDIDSPSYNGGNGSCFWWTGDIGISQPENLQMKYCQAYNTIVNVNQYELISGIKFDVNTLGLNADHCQIHDVSGDGLEVLAGGTGNISNGHTASFLSISNARIGIFLNANNGGVIQNVTVSDSVVQSNQRQYGIYENLGADYNTWLRNTCLQGRVVNPIGGSPHDTLIGNVGF